MPQGKIYTRNELLKKTTSNRVLLDLGCGTRKKDGHIGVDSAKLDGVDIVSDLKNGLPFEDNSVNGIYSSFMFEHLPDIVFLFKEIYRVCGDGAIIDFKVPYYQSFTQFKDPTHRSVIIPETLSYFGSEKWYGSDYGINTNFKILKVDYIYLHPFSKLTSRKIALLRFLTEPILKFSRRHLWNVVHSIGITMETIKR